MDRPLIDEFYSYGYNVIRYEPIVTPKRKQTIPHGPGRMPTIHEIEIPGLGKRWVRFGDTGKCKLSDNCFT